MAKNKKNDKTSNKIYEDNELSRLDKAAKNILSILDSNYSNKEILTTKDQKFRSILNRELEISKGVSHGSIVDFVSSFALDSKNPNKNSALGQNNIPNANDLFTKNINDVFGYFQELYKNRFIEIQDLKFIAKFIPALGEAVKTTLDSIVSSDNIAETVNRSIILPNSVSEADRTSIINEIHRNEKELKLLNKLKNIVYKKTLVTGMHYVYAVSYKKIFEEYDTIKKRSKQGVINNQKFQFGSSASNKANESEIFNLGDVNIDSAMESVATLLGSSKNKSNEKNMTKKEIDEIIHNTYENMPIITCEQSMIYSDALDDMHDILQNEVIMEAYINQKEKRNGNKVNEKLMKNPLEVSIPDGTKSIDSIKPSKFDISGTYIKYIDAKNLIPIKVFDQIVGYFSIHTKQKSNKNSAGQTSGITSIGNTLFSTVDVSEQKKHDAIERIVNSITEGILKNFDNKFVTKNAEFKRLIADCIVSNGLTDKDYNIQFIPAEDIITFTINENEDGFGESILTDSLFPAKLLLSMIVCRMLNYINKTGNKTIAHIHKGPINPLTSNHLNRVIRDIQEQQVTFNDLLSPNLVFNKFNRDGNITIPTAKNGDRLVEFETQEGQNIDMTPDYEEKLENMAILGTGVPTVIMEYAGSADFAKQLVSANIKFAGRVATLQSDLEEPTTLLYKKIITNSNLSDEQKNICAESLEIKLPRPRVLTNSNNNDYVQSIVSTSETIADVALGRDSTQNTDLNPNGIVIKEKLMYDITKSSSPFIDWNEIDEAIKRITMEVNTQDSTEKKENNGF